MSANREMIIRMLQALVEHPCSAHDLVELSGFQFSTVREWLNDMCKLRDGKRLVHRVCYERNRKNNPITPMYVFGHGPMARRPPKLTQAERQARLRERKRLARLHGVPIHAVAHRTQ